MIARRTNFLWSLTRSRNMKGLIVSNFVKIMCDSMAACLKEPTLIDLLDFWLSKLSNQKKFTLMGGRRVTSHLHIDVVNERMIGWHDLLWVDNFAPFIATYVKMLDLNWDTNYCLNSKDILEKTFYIHVWRNQTTATQKGINNALKNWFCLIEKQPFCKISGNCTIVAWVEKKEEKKLMALFNEGGKCEWKELWKTQGR